MSDLSQSHFIPMPSSLIHPISLFSLIWLILLIGVEFILFTFLLLLFSIGLLNIVSYLVDSHLFVLFSIFFLFSVHGIWLILVSSSGLDLIIGIHFPLYFSINSIVLPNKIV